MNRKEATEKTLEMAGLNPKEVMGKKIYASKEDIENLRKKYSSFDIDKLVGNLIEYYNKNPFKEKQRNVHLKEIKESITLFNPSIKDPIPQVTFDGAENLSLLEKGEIIHHNLNQGEHKGNWYFGKLFPYTNEDHEIFGEEREGIIISNKEMRINKLKIKRTKDGIEFLGKNEIKDHGLNYRHQLEVNKNFWSNKRIKKWINDDLKKDGFEIYNKIKDKISYYMDVEDERIFDITACWIIGTYCYELFESYGYLYFNALRESGKSKFKKILRLTGFNGQEASSITEASFFRTIENTKGVLCIDEYERMDTERKKATDLLLNAGIEKGSTVKRVDTDVKPKRNRDYDVYCPKIICNITGLDPVTQSRCITIKLRKTSTKKGNRKPATNDPIWQELRDDCYELIMIHWEDIKDIYKRYKSDLPNRAEDVWLPVLIIAKFFNVENSVLEYAKENMKSSKLDEIEYDRTYSILKELLDYALISEKEVKQFHTFQLAEYLKDKINFGEKNPERVTGWHLTNLNIFKKSRDEKGILYELSKGKILLAMISRDYPIPKKYEKSVKELHNTTTTTKTTTTTTTTKKEENNVDPVVPVVNSGYVVEEAEEYNG